MDDEYKHFKNPKLAKLFYDNLEKGLNIEGKPYHKRTKEEEKIWLDKCNKHDGYR